MLRRTKQAKLGTDDLVQFAASIGVVLSEKNAKRLWKTHAKELSSIAALSVDPRGCGCEGVYGWLKPLILQYAEGGIERPAANPNRINYPISVEPSASCKSNALPIQKYGGDEMSSLMEAAYRHHEDATD